MVVPKLCHETLLDSLHESHMGVSRTKTLARQYFWWPKMDSDVESMVKSCPSCQMISIESLEIPHYHVSIGGEREREM